MSHVPLLGLKLFLGNTILDTAWRDSLKLAVVLLPSAVALTFMSSFLLQTLALVSYLFGKNLKGTTVSNTLSGLRAIHIAEGCPAPVLRTSLINMVLKGRGNWDQEVARNLPKRIPVTIDLLKLLRRKLQLAEHILPFQKALIWSVATLCFWGGLRVDEMLSKTARTIDPLNTLLLDDLSVFTKKIGGNDVRIIKVLLKSTKESRAEFRGVKIEIFETKTKICPVAALLWYKNLLGKPMLGSTLNSSFKPTLNMGR